MPSPIAGVLRALVAAHLAVRVSAGLNAWRVARRALDVREIRDRHGHRVVYRASRAAPYDDALPPIVCVPGLGVSSRYMVPLMHALAPHARVFCPHPPGHAGSDRLQHVSVASYARALLDWLDAVGLPRVVLIANSLGCQIALHVAALAPDRVTHCVLIGPTADRRSRTFTAQASRLLVSVPFDHRSIDLLVLADYASVGVTLGLKEVAAMLADEPERTARAVHCPVLLMRGEHDWVAPQSWLGELAHALPNARTCSVPRAGHAVHYTRAAQVAMLSRRFVMES